MARTDRSAVAKALDLLTALAEADRPLRLSELAERVGLHRATAYRSLDELLKRGFIVRDNEDRYLLGSAILRMADGPSARHALAELVRPVLLRLATSVERIASIGTLEPYGHRIVEAVRPARYQRFFGYAGQVIEPWRSAGGMVLLAFSASAQTAPLLDAATANGVDAEELGAELDAIRRDGHAFFAGRLEPLIAQAAVPVIGAGGACRAAMTLTGLVQDFDEDTLDPMLRPLKDAAVEVEDLLGVPAVRGTTTAG